MKKTIFHVFIILGLVFAFWQIAHKDVQTAEICTKIGTTPVYTLPSLESSVFAVLSRNTIVLWAGVEKNNFIFIRFDDGYGWAELKNFGACDTKPLGNWHEE